MPYCGCTGVYEQLNEEISIENQKQVGMGWLFSDSSIVDRGNNELWNPWLRQMVETPYWVEVKDQNTGVASMIPNPNRGRGLGFDFTDVTGGFSLQTILLIAGVGLVGWMMLSARGGREYVYTQGIVAARSRGTSIKRKVDGRIKEAEGYLQEFRKTGVSKVDKMQEVDKALQKADEAL